MLSVFFIPVVLVIATPVPKYRWPLNTMTCGLEVQTTKADAIQPKKDECSISSPGMVTSLGSDGFVEFTPTQPNIDVTIKDCLLLPSFGFSIFIYPQVSTGTIAHYVATSASVSEFSDFLLTLTNGMLEVTLNIGSEVFSSGAIGVLNINSWNLVVFGFDGAVKKLHLSKHGGSRNQMKNDLGGPLSVPGVLRIGSKQGTSAPERFTGRVACAMLFDEKIEYSQANQAIISFCNSPWENVPSPVPSCVTIPAPPSPHLVWALDEISLGFRATDFKGPLNEPDYRQADGPVSLSGKALYFDGSKFTTLMLDGIVPTLLAAQQSFGMYLYVDQENNATLMHLKTPALDATEVVITVNNKDLVIRLVDPSQQECCNMRIADAFPIETWVVFSFKIEFPNDIVVTINGTEYTGTHSCGPPATSTRNYTLDIGYDGKDKEGFRGRIRCLVLVDDISNMEMVLKHACNTSLGVEVLLLEAIPTERHMYGKLSKRDSSPGNSITPVGVAEVKSLAACGKMCCETRYCRSYTYSSYHGICKLYDIVMFAGLITAIGNSYYTVD